VLMQQYKTVAYQCTRSQTKYIKSLYALKNCSSKV
jgi:hypothetical protein